MQPAKVVAGTPKIPGFLRRTELIEGTAHREARLFFAASQVAGGYVIEDRVTGDNAAGIFLSPVVTIAADHNTQLGLPISLLANVRDADFVARPDDRMSRRLKELSVVR